MNSSQPTKLFRNSTIYAVGDVLRNLVSFVMLPIYTRHLTPADYGVVALVSFAITVFEALLGARLAQAMPKFYYDQNAAIKRYAVISTAYIATGAISSITVSVIFIFRDSISYALFADAKFGLIVGLSALQMFTQALEYYALLYLRLIDKPIAFIAINTAKLVVQLSLNIWLVVHLELGVLGVAISGLASSAVFAVGLSAMVLRSIGIRFDGDLARQMLVFSWPLWLSGLASLYIFSANRYYIRIFDSLAGVGLFELAAKFSAVLGLLIWSPFSQYWQTEQFRIIRLPNAQSLFDTIFRVMSAALILVGLGVSVFSGPVLKVMADPQFWNAAHAVPFLMAATIFGYFVELSAASFLARGETGWLSRNNYFTAFLVTLLYFAMIPLFGYVGAAAALALSQVFRFVVINSAARNRDAPCVHLRSLAMMMLVFVAGCAAANRFLVEDNIWADLALKSLTYVVSAGLIVGVLWADPKSREQLRSLLSRAKHHMSRAGS